MHVVLSSLLQCSLTGLLSRLSSSLAPLGCLLYERLALCQRCVFCQVVLMLQGDFIHLHEMKACDALTGVSNANLTCSFLRVNNSNEDVQQRESSMWRLILCNIGKARWLIVTCMPQVKSVHQGSRKSSACIPTFGVPADVDNNSGSKGISATL